MPDREAVRPPMPWADLAGAGFTTADESSLPRMPVRDGAFGYRNLNVEDQQTDAGSFLNWMERVIRTRRAWPVIGWGEWQLLGTRESRALAHVATWSGTSFLAVHNFADEAVRVSIRIPTSALGGRWRHLIGSGDDEPQVASGRLTIEIEPYGYHWFGATEGV